MKKRKHSGFRSQEARHGRWATFGTLCCSSSVLNAQRRKSTSTRRQAVDSTTSIDDYCIMCSFFFFFLLLPYLRLKGHSAVPRNRRIVESQSFCFSYALKRRSPQRRPTDRLKPVAERRHLGADSAPKRKSGEPVDFRKPQSPE